MKILKTDSFVSERIKVKPITNAELDVAEKEMNAFRKIENPTFADIKPGMAVLCEVTRKSGLKYNDAFIVFDSTKLPSFIMRRSLRQLRYDGNMFLVKYDTLDLTFNVSYLSLDDFKENFPYNRLRDVEILGVYDARIDTMAIKTLDDLKRELVKVNRKTRNIE